MPCHYLLHPPRNVEQLSGSIRNKPFGEAAMPSPTTVKTAQGCVGVIMAAVLISICPLDRGECIMVWSFISIESKIKWGEIFRKFELSFAYCLSKKSQIFISLMSVGVFPDARFAFLTYGVVTSEFVLLDYMYAFHISALGLEVPHDAEFLCCIIKHCFVL